MARYLLAAVGALILLSAGCLHTEYTIKMTAQDARVQRRTVAEQKDTQGEPPPPVVTEGAHDYLLPDDVKGNNGRYFHYASDMGASSGYLERFRGRDDQAALLAEQFAAADQFTDILAGWLEQEHGKDPQFAKLKAFVVGPFRQDLKNVGVYLWQNYASRRQLVKDGQAGEWGDADTGARLLQYLFEHDYATKEDLNRLAGLMAADEKQGLRLGSELLAHILRRKAGLGDSKLADTVAAHIIEREASAESLAKYVGTTEHYRKAVADWKKEQPKEEQPKEGQEGEGISKEPPQPADWLGQLAMRSIGFRLDLGTADKVNLSLAVPVEPTQTNGKWDAGAGEITWKFEIGEAGLPVVCFAMWDRPNEAFQKAHLGKVRVAGDDLSQYCLWYVGLTKDQRGRWDKFVAGLAGGEGLSEKLRNFTFDAATTGSEPVVPGAKIILGQIEREYKEQQAEKAAAEQGNDPTQE